MIEKINRLLGHFTQYHLIVAPQCNTSGHNTCKKLQETGDNSDAKGTNGPKTPCGRDRLCCNDSQDRDGRSRRDDIKTTREAPERPRGGKGTRGIHDSTGTQRSGQKGRCGAVGLMSNHECTAASIANTFLDLQSEDDSKFPPIDQMKIQKLVFYAHAWFLAMKDRPLFEDDIEAWPWGPVVRNLYLEFKDFNSAPIVGKRATEIMSTGPDPLDYEVREVPSVTDLEVMEHLRETWRVHKPYTGIQLSNSTHAPNEPWTIVKQKQGHLENKPRIPNDLIKNVFKQKISSN